MRVLIINTSEKTGGAAVAANRLCSALNKNGVDAKMLVMNKETDSPYVIGLPHPKRNKINVLGERLSIFSHLHFSKNHLFEIDIANMGCDITQLQVFKEADVIHLSWINQGMLSLNNIKKILLSGKPVVWTLHDLWPLTGICHYPHECVAFKSECKRCTLLPNGGSDHDLSTTTWQRKKDAYECGNIQFVGCSKWIAEMAMQSGLFSMKKAVAIPNPIDTELFKKLPSKQEQRAKMGLPEDKHIILFASQRVTDQRKGMKYFIEAIDKMVAQHPETKDNTAVAILGGHSDELVNSLSLPAYSLGYVSDANAIVDTYNTADIFVLPSLEDNLPNTIMEAMACGVPCVAFGVGGIPEMISHKQTGYIAHVKDSTDLSAGMYWTLFESDYEATSDNAVRKVKEEYSMQKVASDYTHIYDTLCNCKTNDQQ